MNRLATGQRVFFLEEFVVDTSTISPWTESRQDPAANVNVVIPHLPEGLDEQATSEAQSFILKKVLRDYNIREYVSWYYSPMALAFTDDLEPVYTVYDCMDELSAFLFAPPALKEYENALLQKADIVFTGGRSLYLAKKNQHSNIYAFPSSIEKDHFRKARTGLADPVDQQLIPHPRIGFYGVIDERLNICLLDELSVAKTDWQFILAGPTVKIDPATLPKRNNIHYLGSKDYAVLPDYLSGWDIAMMPFALNASTRFISPTKTPEYLAGGKPVISPSIADVIKPYGELGLVEIADTAQQFIIAAEKILNAGVEPEWLNRVDTFLSTRSWEKTVIDMKALIDKGIKETAVAGLHQKRSYV